MQFFLRASSLHFVWHCCQRFLFQNSPSNMSSSAAPSLADVVATGAAGVRSAGVDARSSAARVGGAGHAGAVCARMEAGVTPMVDPLDATAAKACEIALRLGPDACAAAGAARFTGGGCSFAAAADVDGAGGADAAGAWGGFQVQHCVASRPQ